MEEEKNENKFGPQGFSFFFFCFDFSDTMENRLMGKDVWSGYGISCGFVEFLLPVMIIF